MGILRLARLALRYPLFLASLASAGAAGTLILAGQSTVATWLVIALAVVIIARELVLMIGSFRRGSWGVDILAITAITATLLVGELVATTVILIMLTGGEALQDYAEHRARADLTALMERSPSVGHLVVGESTRDVQVNDLAIGDVVEVRPGETVPVDGELLADGVFDESSITGEPLPVERAAGTTVLSGAVNGDTVVRVRATATAAESQLAAIIDLVAASADSRAAFVRLADRIAVPFTLVAGAIAVTAWLVSGDPGRLAEVLVVATPCPLLIAAPVAFIAGTNRAARAGMIVKSGTVLERVARIRGVAFDKTGTLTEGTPRVVRVEPASQGADPLRLAAAVEAHSSHLLAAAVVRSAGAGIEDATSVTETPGLGASGEVAGTRVLVGKRAFVEGVVRSIDAAPLGSGETAVYVAAGDDYVGRIVLRDEVRADARAVVRALGELGIREVVMLTGDGEETARTVAEIVGISQVRASLLPAQKVAAVREIVRPAMMVGDGVNDAPVLAAADVGVAMGARGATAASESADVVVLVDDLTRVPQLLRIAKRTVRIASQSAWVGVGASVLLMVVASFGVLPAVLGALLQEALDVLVILNGLRAVRGDASAAASSAGDHGARLRVQT